MPPVCVKVTSQVSVNIGGLAASNGVPSGTGTGVGCCALPQPAAARAMSKNKGNMFRIAVDLLARSITENIHAGNK